MLADLIIDVRIFTLLLGLFIKVETVAELGFELTISGLQVLCSITRKIRAMICLHDSSEVIARTQ